MSIRPLSIEVANQIAAGEVIERPASIVKELIENAVDANATDIKIEILSGGLSSIIISDNGKGIVSEELKLAVMPHATSKLSHIDDLLHLSSFGFRGEALASISSVCEFSIHSKPLSQKNAYTLRVNHGRVGEIQPGAYPNGTCIECHKLFYNVPARRKFLKQPKTEYLHIETVVKRVAMAHPNISFTLKHNDKVTLLFKAGDIQNRLKQIFGTQFFNKQLNIDKVASGLSITGAISSPNFLRGQNDLQYLYVNERIVRDKLVSHVIRQLYEPLLHPGKVPCYLLHVSLPPEEVDVNVHPAKSEVRFQKPKEVYDFIKSALFDAIRCYQQSETIEEHRLEKNEKAGCKTTTTSYVQKSLHQESIFSENGQWIDLGNKLALLLSGNHTFLIQVEQAYKRWVSGLYLKAVSENKINSRQVLVPLVVNMSASQLAQYPFHLSQQLGFDVEQLTESKLVVRAAPTLLPYINIHDYVLSLSSVRTLDEAVELSLYHTDVSLELLDDVEKKALMQFVIGQNNNSSDRRLLKAEDWLELMNV